MGSRSHIARIIAPLNMVVALSAAILLGIFGPASSALAHTELVHWEFVSGDAGKPHDLQLRFSEPIDATFLTVAVMDRGGNRQPLGTASIDPRQRTDGLVDISRLPPGTYSVAWWTRALDGDPSNGSFFMGIGTTVEPVALLPPVAARDPATQPAMFYEETIWDAVFHWLTYLGAALTIGSLGFALIIWRPVAQWVETGRGSMLGPVPEPDDRMLRTLRSLAVAGSLLFLFANLLLLLMQTEFIRYSLLQPVTGVNPTPLEPSALSHEPPYQSVADIFRGYNGRVWIARMVLGAATLALSFGLRRPVTRPPWRGVAALVAALAALATVSLTAHAAVVPRSELAVVADWSHMAAMSLWLGGLIPLVFVLREGRRQQAGFAGLANTSATSAGVVERRAEPPTLAAAEPAAMAGVEARFRQEWTLGVVRRFSTMALLAVIYLVTTGLFAAYLHVGDPSLLVPTTYGRALIAKLVLFSGLFAMGAIHRRVSIPRLDRYSVLGRSTLERLLPLEIGVGCALLVAVAVMASLGTSSAVWPAHQALGIARGTTTSAVTATFRAVPGKAGENAIALDIADRRFGRPTTIRRATLKLGGEMLELTPVGPLAPGTVQRFISTDLVDIAQGKGSVGFTVSRPDYPEISGSLLIDVPPAASSAGAAN